jgi:hypothetical protein
MVAVANSHTNTTRIGSHLWEIDLRFAPGLPPGWLPHTLPQGPLPCSGPASERNGDNSKDFNDFDLKAKDLDRLMCRVS